MGKKNVTLSLDEELYQIYSELCKKLGLVLSRQVELMMEEKLNNV
jgi:hypothetical protein